VSDVTEILARLQLGEMTLDQAAAAFARMSWPSPPQLAPGEADAGIFPGEPEGGFGEVAAAYAAGQITAGQYQVLARAAAGAS
jgi:hypothetical protein